MADRALLYSVSLNIAQARSQAQTMTRLFQAELRQINFQLLDPRSVSTATAQFRTITSELNKGAAEAERLNRSLQSASRVRVQPPPVAQTPVGGGIPQLGGFGGALQGGIAGYLSVQGVRAIAQEAIAMAELGTQVSRTEKAFQLFSGSSQEAEARLRAVQTATGGTVDRLTAMSIANQAAALGLAKTSSEFENLARAARIIAFVSPTIKDVNEALTQLSLFAANPASFARADQLGLSVSEVKDRMAELQAENSSLDDSTAKLTASIEVLNSKYGNLLNTSEAQASGLERLRVSLTELRQEAALGIVLPIVNPIAETGANIADFFTGKAFDVQNQQSRIPAEIARLQSEQEQGQLFGLLPVDNTRSIQALEQYQQLMQQISDAQNQGVPGMQQYADAVTGVGNALLETGVATDETLNLFARTSAEVTAAGRAFGEFDTSAQAAAATSAQAAQDLISTFQQLDTLIATAGEFDTGIVPGAQEAQQALLDLKIEIASTGTVTENQAQQIAALEGVLGNASSAVQFLSTTEGQAAIATGGLNAALATTPGYLDAISLSAAQAGATLQQALAIQGQVEAGLVSGLTGLISRGRITSAQANQLLTEQQSGIRSGAAGIAGGNLTPQERAFAQAELQRQTNAQVEAIEENARAQEAAQRKAASAAESAFKKAASATESAWKDAANKLKEGLSKTPGVFGRSSVTEEDMKLSELGLYQPKADEYLRQLEDEVFNKVDTPASIEEAREALNRVGIVAGETAEATFLQFANAWDDQSLFSHPGNLELYNEDAVKAEMMLQEKQKQGAENITQYFASIIDASVKPFLPGGEGLDKPAGLPEGYTMDADGNIAAPRGAWAGIDQDKLMQIQELPNRIIDQALTQVDEAIAGGGLTGLGGTGLTGGLATGVEGAPGVTGLTGTITSLTVDPAATESLLSGLRGGLASEENVALLDGIGQGISQFIGIGIAQYDFVPTATTIIGNLRAGIAAEDNLERLLGAGEDIVNVIRDGMTATAEQPDWAESIVSTIVAGIMQTMNQEFAQP